MAQPVHSAKKSVDLASGASSSGPRVSRIRRDPPPVVKETIVDVDERDRSDVVIGIVAFALAIFAVILAFGIYSSWTPRAYTIEVNDQA